MMSWLPDHPVVRWVAVAVVALVVLGGIAGAGWAWYSAQESRAREAYAGAAEMLQQAQAPNAMPEARERAIAALESVVTGHPRSAVAVEAAYQLGNLRYAAGQYAQARGAYELAISRGAGGTIRTLSAVGIGYTWEAEKSYAKAQTAFDAALSGRGPKDFMYEELLIDLARVQEFGGNRPGALETYQRLLKDVPDSRRADDIRSRVASLQSQPK